MGRDVSVQAIPFEGSEAYEPAASKDNLRDVVGNVAHNIQEKTHTTVEVIKEKAHDAAETIKWQAGEIRDGVSRRMSTDKGVPPMPLIPEEPVLVAMTPIAKDPFVGEAPLKAEQDLPREKNAVINVNPVVPMDVEQNIERPSVTFWDRAFQAKLALEEKAHNMRLRMDDAIKYQLGPKADVVQEEVEKARVSAIAGTAYMAELLQGQFRKASLLLRNRQPAPVVPVAPVVDPSQLPSTIMEQKLEVDTSEPTNTEPIKSNGNDNSSWSEKVEHMKEGTITESAYVADLLQEQFGKLAVTLREQQQSGIAPAYR